MRLVLIIAQQGKHVQLPNRKVKGLLPSIGEQEIGLDDDESGIFESTIANQAVLAARTAPW